VCCYTLGVATQINDGLAPQSIYRIEHTFIESTNKLIATIKMNILRQIKELVLLVIRTYLPDQATVYHHEIIKFYDDFEKLVSSRGLSWAIKYVKLSRLACTRYISGNPLSSLEGVALCDG
jgi:hypothetical protein